DVPRPGFVQLLARVLVPDGEVADPGSAEEVGLAVAVEVRGADGSRLGDLLVEEMFGPLLLAGALPGVLEPREVIAGPRRGRCVEVAAALEVRQGDVVSAFEVRRDDMAFPDRVLSRFAAVLEPDQVAVEVLDDDDVRPLIAVDVTDGVALEPAGLVFL